MHGNSQHFHAHETAREETLEGRPLATFGQRALGFIVDLIVAVIIWAPLEFLVKRFLMHQADIELKWDFHERGNILVMILYYGLANYFGNGRTVGKCVARIRAVSLVSERMGLWQSIERALGYGVAVAEVVGFVQYFWSPNRMCVQDRIAETIVVDERRRTVATPPATEGEDSERS